MDREAFPASPRVISDISSRMSDPDSSFRMAARVPQRFLTSDPAVQGFAMEGAPGLPPGSELNHPPYAVWPPLVSQMPVASGIRSGEILSNDEVAGPLQDSVLDQRSVLVPRIIVQPGGGQQLVYCYGGGGEVPEYYHPYEDLKGILADGRLASGTFSDVSLSATSDKHVETASQGCSSLNSSMGEHPGPRIKLMCSFGGKILPRPGDGKLRYVGGETRIVSVRRQVTFADLKRKMMQLYGQAVIMKYQLPDEDLDALISVSSDEDLENMMEEYDRLDSEEGNPRVRTFLFSLAEGDAVNANNSAERKSTELMFVDAINALTDSRSSKQLDSMSATSNDSTYLRAADAWNAPRMSESVPVSALASGSSMMQSLPGGSASQTKPILSRILSAPVSAPPSPQIYSQSPQIRQLPIPDISLHDQPPTKAPLGPYHEMYRGDGDGVGSATSSVNSQLDSPYGAFEPRRVIDSPTNAQQEMMMAHGDTLDQQLHRPEPLRTADVGVSRVDSQSSLTRPDSFGRVPRVDSHGNLIPSQEQLMELGVPLTTGENNLPNITRAPMDVQSFAAQSQLQVPQTAVQHTADAYHEAEAYQRMQQSAPENMQAHPQALHHRQQIVAQPYPPAGRDAVQQAAAERMHPQVLPYYRQPVVSQFYPPIVGLDQLQQSALENMSQQQAPHHYHQYVSQLYAPIGTSDQEMRSFTKAEQPMQQDDASTGQLPFKSGVVQVPVNPSQMGAVSFPVSQLASGQLPSDVVLQGNNLKQGGVLHYFPAPGGLMDLPYGRIPVQPSNEQANRVLKPPNIPIDSREQMYLEGKITRDQASMPFVNVEKKFQENKADSVPKKHDTLQPQSYYSDELTRAVIPPYPGVSTHQDGLVHFTDHGISRRESKEHMQQHEEEELAARLRYQGGVDWSMQNMYKDSEKTMSGWAQTGQGDTKKDSAAEVASSEIYGKSPANAPSLHILEPSFVATAAGETHPTGENMGNQFNPIGRAGAVPTVVAGHLPTSVNPSVSESSQPTYLPVRYEGDGLPKLAVTNEGTNTQDASSIPSREAGNANLVSLGTHQILDDKAAGLGPSAHAGPLLAPPPNMVQSAILAKMEEGRWNEDFKSDRLSGNVSGRHSNEAALELSTTLSSDAGLSRPASGDMIATPEALLDSTVVNKNSSNKSSTDGGVFGPPFSHMQTTVPNGTSYPIGLNAWGLGLDGFQTNIPVTPPDCTSAADGLSTSDLTFPLMGDTVTTSSGLAQAGKDSSHGETTASRQREELVEGIHTRADAFLDNKGLINAASMVPVDSGQVSKSPEEKRFFPMFDLETVPAVTPECEDEDAKVDLEHVAKDVAAAVLLPAPTLSIQNWEDTLANVEKKEDVSKESFLVDESLDDVKLHVGEKVVTFQETKTGSKEADKDKQVANKQTNVATIAEEDAVAHGLQTVKNADLEELRELGSGTFGTVYHGKWRGTDVAIKRIKSSVFMGRPSERERLIADFWREAYILGQLHHPNVVAFYGVVRDGPGGTLATVTEFMVNGSLKQFLQRKDRAMDRRRRFSIIMDAAFGMEYLHGKNIVHFDLKCENLLVNMRDSHRPVCKVGDLGLSKVKHQTMVSGGVRGTLPWMAPELLNGSSSLVSEKVDVFSFGIVMWELLTGEEPYANMHYGAIIGGIVNNTLRPTVPSSCDPAWKSLMERCWSAEPSERPSFSEIASELRAMAAAASSKAQVQAPTAG